MGFNQYASEGVPVVAVVGANSLVGEMLLRHLEGTLQTVALVRSAARLPATSIITNWMSSPEAERAMREADVLVHLCGDLFAGSAAAYRAANVETTERVTAALRSGRASRAIFISYVGADPDSSNLFLQTKGEAERLLLASGKEVVVFRCPAIINTPDKPGPIEQNLKAQGTRSVRLLGNGRQRQQPVYRGDVVRAIAAAIERGTPGVYDLTGPEEMIADDLIRLINRNRDVRISHVPAWLARTLSLFVAELPSTFVDIMLRDAVGDSSRAVTEFGLKPTLLSTLWRTDGSTSNH